MALSMDFYAGQPDDIGRLFADRDFATLNAISPGASHADFTLPIELGDLDLLTQEVADTLNVNCPDFWPSLGAAVGGDQSTRGARVVSPLWVSLIASIEDKDAGNWTEAWLSLVADERKGSSPTADAAAVSAVSLLARLCRRAESHVIPVVFCWTL